MCLELDNAVHLDLSNNLFTDDSVYNFIKYVFANDESKLLYFNLENNNFTSRGKRTMLKGYSMSENRKALQLKLGPI